MLSQMECLDFCKKSKNSSNNWVFSSKEVVVVPLKYCGCLQRNLEGSSCDPRVTEDRGGSVPLDNILLKQVVN